jgi:hypothetical protein
MPAKKAAPRPIKQPPPPVIPAGRLLELQLETNLPQPYVLTDTITVYPPNKARADKIREAQMTKLVYSALLSQTMNTPGATQDLLEGLNKKIEEADNAYQEALLGDSHDDVIALLATLDDQLAQAFQRDVVKQFFPNQPVDGKCQACGQVIDEEQEGKASASSP